jgi:hypothetical protein
MLILGAAMLGDAAVVRLALNRSNNCGSTAAAIRNYFPGFTHVDVVHLPGRPLALHEQPVLRGLIEGSSDKRFDAEQFLV